MPVFAEGLPLYFESEVQNYMPVKGAVLECEDTN